MGYLPDVPEEPGHRRGRDGGAGHRHRRGRHRRALSRPRRHRTAGSARSSACRCMSATRTIGAIGLSFPGTRDPGRGRARVPRDPGRHLRPGARADQPPRRPPPSRAPSSSSSPTPRPSWPAASTTRRTLAEGGPAGRADLRRLVRDRRRRGRPAAPARRRARGPGARSQLAHELAERYPTDPDAPNGAWEVMRTGQSELIAEITDEMLVAGADGRGAPAHRPRPAPAQRPHRAAGGPGPGPRRDHLGLGRVRAALRRRRPRASPRTWPSAPRSRSTTPSCTARPWPRPSSCSTPCCPRRCRRRPAGRSRATTAPRGAPRSAATSTTPSPLGDGRLALFVGDVMGRGVAAAAAMAADAGGRAGVRRGRPDARGGAAQARPDVRRVPTPTSSSPWSTWWSTRPGTSSSVANAGHPPPVLLRADRCDRAAAPGRRVPPGRVARGPPAGHRRRSAPATPSWPSPTA